MAAKPSNYREGHPPVRLSVDDIYVYWWEAAGSHVIYLLAMLAALGLPFTERLLIHAHWTVNRFKTSKSIGNVADPISAIDEFGTDVVRWYLARIRGYFRDDVGTSNSFHGLPEPNISDP